MKDWLAGTLARYRPGEQTEAGYLDAYHRLLALPGDVFDATHFVPGHVTASAFVASRDGSSVLLIHHGKLEKWLQPGGHVEPDDRSLEDASRREVAEEVGLEEMVGLGFLDLDIHVFPRRPPTPEHLHFDVRFAFQASADSIDALDGVVEARWVPFAEVNEISSDLSVSRPVAKLRRMLL